MLFCPKFNSKLNKNDNNKKVTPIDKQFVSNKKEKEKSYN